MLARASTLNSSLVILFGYRFFLRCSALMSTTSHDEGGTPMAVLLITSTYLSYLSWLVWLFRGRKAFIPPRTRAPATLLVCPTALFERFLNPRTLLPAFLLQFVMVDFAR